jgi:putative endonuclease
MGLYHVYILECSDGSFYVGSTTNLKLRLQEHSEGKSSYTSAHLPVKLVYTEEYETLTEARQREMQLHKWSRIKKEKLINGEWSRPDSM